MASFYFDHPAIGAKRVKRGMRLKEAVAAFKPWVASVAKQNGWAILSCSDTEATLGLKVEGVDKPAVAAYLSVEPSSPPSKPEPGQPCRRALKGL